MITRLVVDKQFYGGAFSKIYWFSPSASVDEGLDPLRKYVAGIQNQEDDPSFHDDFDPAFVRSILEKARQVTEHQKQGKSNKRFNQLLVIDDHADRPDLLKKAGGIFETLFVRARHWGVSTIVSSQKLRLISSTVRTNLTALFVFRLRNHHDLKDGVIEEYSALVDGKTLMQLYKQAVSRPFGFLYINLLSRDVNHMFYSSFKGRFVLEDDEDEEQK